MSTSSDSDSDTAQTPPSSPPHATSEQPSQEQVASAKSDAQNKVTEMDHIDLPYYELPAEFVRGRTCSNKPGDLQLQTYFNPKKPNLGRDFGVEGLMPVLREKKGDYRFILADKRGRFYVYEEEDGFLYWVKSRKLEYMDSDVEKVDYIMCSIGALDTEPIFPGKHPADRAQFSWEQGMWITV